MACYSSSRIPTTVYVVLKQGQKRINMSLDWLPTETSIASLVKINHLFSLSNDTQTNDIIRYMKLSFSDKREVCAVINLNYTMQNFILTSYISLRILTQFLSRLWRGVLYTLYFRGRQFISTLPLNYFAAPVLDYNPANKIKQLQRLVSFE